jgi:NAD(P)H-hydrate repair Nnr-like enzyme with NAD(P)H-hydrate dehydratase domain
MAISGCDLYINDKGNPLMATAGSGDVLSGIIASFLAQGYQLFTAATFSVYIWSWCRQSITDLCS